MGRGGLARGLQDPFLSKTSFVRPTPPHAVLYPVFHQGKSLGARVSRSPPQASHRTGSSDSRLLQSPIYGPEGFRGVVPHHRPVYPEHLHRVSALSYGNSSVRPPFHSPGRLDDLLGSAGRIPSSSGPSGIASVSSLHHGRSSIPVQGTVLRADTAPQVFTRLMAPISAILHRYGIRMLRYLDDWLILAESRITCLQARDRLLQLCEELGLQVNHRKSSLVPSQDMTYLGMQILSVRFVAKPTETRVVNLLNIIEEFLSSPDPPAALWRRLLGHLSSLTLLVKGGMLRMRSLQIRLRSKWNFRDDYLRISWDPLCQEDLLWWSWAIQQLEGVDLSLPVPDLSFYSDASDVGLGCHRRGTPSVRSLDSEPKGSLHQPQGDDGSAEWPLPVQLSSQRQDNRPVLRQCHDSRLPQAIGRHEVSGPVPQGKGDSPVGRVYEDHAPSPVHPGVSQHESGSSQSTQSGDRIGVDTTPGGGPGSSPPVAGDHRPIRDLADGKAPSVLCSSVGTQGSGGRCIPPALGQSPGVCLPSHSHHKESSSHPDRPILASKGMVSRYTGTSIRHSNRTTQTSRSATTTAFPPVSRKSPNASSDCVATLKRFARQAGFSETVAGQLALCRRTSTRLNYQARWGKFRKWCRDFHHRSSEPTIPKIAEFLTFLFKTEKAAVSTIKGYRAMLSSVFKFCLPEISTSPILKDLVRSFEISAPHPLHQSPPWDLDKLLGYLSGPPFEPLADASFRNKSRKALFLVAMATAKRVGELQALSFSVSHRGGDLVLHYDPFFSGKNKIGVEPPSQICHSPVSGRLCWRSTRTGFLPCSRCSLSPKSCSLC